MRRYFPQSPSRCGRVAGITLSYFFHFMLLCESIGTYDRRTSKNVFDRDTLLRAFVMTIGECVDDTPIKHEYKYSVVSNKRYNTCTDNLARLFDHAFEQKTNQNKTKK